MNLAPLIHSHLRLEKDVIIESESHRKQLLRANLPTHSKTPKSVDYLHDFIFPTQLRSIDGDDIIATAEITIYIVGTNSLHINNLCGLLICIPSRVFVMKTTDFFLRSEGEDTTVKVHRLAALRGSAHIHGFPAIVFDFSDETTIIAAGWDGRLLGENITSGLWQRLQCLSGSNSSLSTLSEDRVKEIIYEVINNDSKSKKPLSIFANNIEKSTIATALSEVSNHARYLHRIWLEKVGSPEPKPSKEQTRNTFNFCKENWDRRGSVIGKQRNILQRLLKDSHGGLIECPKSKNQKQSDKDKIYDIPFSPFPDLISLGIHNTILRMRHILAEKGEEVLKDFLASTNMEYIKKDTALSSKAKKLLKKRKKPENVSDGSGKKNPKEILITCDQEDETHCSEKKSSSKKETKKKSSKKKKKNSSKEEKKILIDDVRGDKADPLLLSPTRHYQKQIYKRFNDEPKPYLGEIVSHIESEGVVLWRVKYEDGDEEDLDEKELLEGLKLFASIKK